jgi:hypothetical protein
MKESFNFFGLKQNIFLISIEGEENDGTFAQKIPLPLKHTFSHYT